MHATTLRELANNGWLEKLAKGQGIDINGQFFMSSKWAEMYPVIKEGFLPDDTVMVMVLGSPKDVGYKNKPYKPSWKPQTVTEDGKMGNLCL